MYVQVSLFLEITQIKSFNIFQRALKIFKKVLFLVFLDLNSVNWIPFPHKLLLHI